MEGIIYIIIGASIGVFALLIAGIMCSMYHVDNTRVKLTDNTSEEGNEFSLRSSSSNWHLLGKTTIGQPKLELPVEVVPRIPN